MKRSILLALFISFIPGYAISEQLKIGVSLPLSGSAASYGNDIKNVLSFLNKRHPEHDLKLIFEDDKCDAKEAVSIAHRFVNIDKVAAATGLPCSGAALASAAVYERAEVLMVSIGAGSPSLTQAGEYIFRSRPSDLKAGEVLAKYISNVEPRIGILAEETEYAQGLAEAFENLAKPAGLEIFRDSFLSNATDVSSQVLKLASKSQNALLLIGQSERTLTVLVKGARDLKYNGKLYSSVLAGSSAFLTAAGAQAEGIIFATLPGKEALLAKHRKLFDQYVEEYGTLNSVEYMFPISFAGYQALAKALRSGNPRASLNRDTFEGANGDFTFDNNGDLVGMEFVIKEIVNGKAELLSSR